MKKKLSILSLLGSLAILIVGAMILSSCEGPMGPAGADGSDGSDGANGINGVDGQDGADGADGTDGTDGVAGNAVCMECHVVAVKEARMAEWETSTHATGNHARYGSRNGCAKCHAHEGFVETVWTGQDTTAAGFALPQQIRCETCHDFHSSLDFENEANSAIRTIEAVALMTGGDVEFSNAESNLCMNCHQSRHAAPDDSDGDLSTEVWGHFGPHHGPQANFINGLVGYEFGVSLGTSGTHETGASCVSCHMVSTDDAATGNHNFVPAIEACTGCHSGATDFDINGAVTEIAGLLTDLHDALDAAGMLDVDGDVIEDVFYGADSVGAAWNYVLVLEDQSGGIHNPAYAKALLTNSINALD